MDCPIEVARARDPKGLYKKAAEGAIKGFTGISDPYEPPTAPELVIRTAEGSGPEESAEALRRFVEGRIR